MVQKTITIYTDDLTGKESPEIDTHSFALNGVSYEIDLAPESYDEMAAAFGRFIEAGRKTGRAKGAKRAVTGGPTAEQVRAWARDNGHEVNERGRVPAAIREAYDAAN